MSALSFCAMGWIGSLRRGGWWWSAEEEKEGSAFFAEGTGRDAGSCSRTRGSSGQKTCGR